jgi:hypothetical protein
VTISWSPSEPVCCTHACKAAWAAAKASIVAHEQGHVHIVNAAIARANRTWHARHFRVCEVTRPQAETALIEEVHRAYHTTVALLEKDFAQEPPQGRAPDCKKCTPKQEGHTCCKETCIDTQTDPNNCGRCGTVCPKGETCRGGKCEGTCASASDCAAGLRCCYGKCVDIQTDAKNCGYCGGVCNLYDACLGLRDPATGGIVETECVNGKCVECPPPYSPCGFAECCGPGQTCAGEIGTSANCQPPLPC